MIARHFSKAARRERRRRYTIRERLTAPWRALPDFLVIGAMKAGTTSLHAYLRQHPRIVPARKKEVKYFDFNARRSLNWYRAHFPLREELAREGALTGEASPHYLLYPAAPRLIHERLGTPRLIAILRNPVDRLVSHYGDLRRRSGETRPLERLIRRVPDSDEGYVRAADDPAGWRHPRHARDLVAIGIYDVQLRRYFETFGRDAVHVMFLEELAADPRRALTAVFRFLGLEAADIADLGARNTGGEIEVDAATRARLAERFAEPDRRLAELIGRDLPW